MYKLVKNIVGFALQYRQLVLFMVLMMALLGTAAYIKIPIESFPDVAPPRVVIISQWPGRSAEEVEKFVTIPIEVELNAVPQKTSLRSISLYGLSVVTLFFEDGIQESEAQEQVALRLGNANVPEGIDTEIQPSSGPTGEIFRYTIKATQGTIRQMKTIQDWMIERAIKSVPGVADVVSFGGEVKTYEVAVDPRMLMRYDLTALDVFDALSRSNINVGGDVIVKADQSYVVRGIGLLNSVQELENVIVTSNGDVPVLVRHLGKVQEVSLPPLGYVGRDTIRNLVEGIVLLRRGENPAPALKALKEKIQQLNENILPDGVEIVPFYDRSDLIKLTTTTVTKNTIEGILLVIVVVFAFLLEWRSSLIVATIIPLSLLFAFFCLNAMGMSANLLSLGAIDFGIIIDGSVVMVEGLFVVMAHKAHQIGMPAYNKLSKNGLIRTNGAELGKNILVAQIIIITALLPVFLFEKVEGKMFSPLAYTMGFALLGALICSLTYVPLMMRLLMNKNVVERENPVVEWIKRSVLSTGKKLRAMPKLSISGGVVLVVGSIYTFLHLGTEFLPQLNEGAIYVRAAMPLSSSLQNSIEATDEMRKVFLQFPEVRQVLSQTGRPNDGTDPTGFFNIEFHVDLLPKDQWQRDISREQLISEMKSSLQGFQGVNFNFSQPIMDNVEEAVSGVKGSIAVKIFGTDPETLEIDADKLYKILNQVEGIEDLAIIPLTGQPEIRIDLNQQKMAIFGISTADCQAIIEMAVGGKAATYMYEGERKFAIRLRYQSEYRDNEEKLGNLLIPGHDGKKVPLRSIAEIKTRKGVAFLYREDNNRFIAVKFSVRGRDLGSTIAEAQKKVEAAFPVKKLSKMAWKGEFENQQRATARLAQTVPIALLLVFLLLYGLTGRVGDTFLILLNVPFALVGGSWALHLTGLNFSISAGIGFVAVMGICIQNGVILLSVFRKNLQHRLPLNEAVSQGILERTRPVVMTALIAAIGLTPAALSTGIGSETQKPLAVVVIGGLISSTLLTLMLFPVIFEWVNRQKKLSLKRS